MGEPVETGADRNQWIRRRRSTGHDFGGLVEALSELVVTPDEETSGALVVDATALATNEHMPTVWVLYPVDGEWEHGPSGTRSPLVEALICIAETYRVVTDA